MFKKLFAVACLCVISVKAFAILDLSLTKGAQMAMPIAVVPFQGDRQGMANVISNDLNRSGQFTVVPFARLTSDPQTGKDLQTQDWRALHVNNTVLGSVKTKPDGRLQVHAKFYDIVNVGKSVSDVGGTALNPLLFDHQYTISQRGSRAASHRISDTIFESVTGIQGAFSTKITYVVKSGKPHRWRYELVVADQDGFNPRPILISPQVIMSPAWSPDGKHIAYVSFESHYPAIYVVDVASGKRKLISKFPGINGAPAWAPDGKSIALVLSKSGSPNIYRFDLVDNRLQQLTNDDWINTEPSFSPNGKALLFTSNRDGGPQIYEYTFADRSIKRVSFIGAYNARASFTPDGEHIIFLHRETDDFSIAWQDLNSGELKVLVKANVGESPSVSPNGEMVVYATQKNGKGILAMASVNGRSQCTLPSQNGSVQEPAWSPYLS